MRKQRPHGLAVLALFLTIPLLLGWFHVLSEETWFAANPHLDYAEVQRDPQLHQGEVLILAGQVLQNRTGPTGTALEVLCYTRDEADRPQQPDPACGAFLVEVDRILEGEFDPGRLVTLAGEVSGRRENGRPVFSLVEIHPWLTPAEKRPSVYPYPYRSGWRCDPWRYDPFCDPWRPYPYDYRWRGSFGWGW